MALVSEASAPSNIALIKYMGKSKTSANLPANASLSWTLENLRTFVTLEEAASDSWAPLPGFAPIALTDKGREKFLGHLARLKEAWGVQGHFLVKSANNFPSDCGLASSASSFAALTLAVHDVWLKQTSKSAMEPAVLSRWARLGSGSSCRSLFSPWAVWKSEGAESAEGLRDDIDHAVILVEESIKQVSSSEAHVRVATSPNYVGRADRANLRLDELLSALRNDNWGMAFELCWAEFEDMHTLFETSSPKFSYRTPGTFAALKQLRAIWEKDGDGPIVTMDAGANIHILLRRDQRSKADEWLSGLKILKSWN